MDSTGNCMGIRNCGNSDKGVLGILPEVGIFRTLYWNGVDLCTCIYTTAQLPVTGAFGWLLAGGIIYTVGGVIYALKLPIFNRKHKNFGSHEIFHLFVMGGSLCHFVVMYAFVL